MSRERGMRIGDVASQSGVRAKTIRFWEDQRLLPPPARTPAGYRDYGPAILERLAFIRQAQASGLTLTAIRQVLEVRDGGQPPCLHATGLIARRRVLPPIPLQSAYRYDPYSHGNATTAMMPAARA